MTIATRTSKAAFSGNGVTTAFPLPFPFRRDADIKALLREGGNETPLELGAHFALSGAGSAEGGRLTMAAAPVQGQTLVVWRAPDIVQEVDYVENAAFPAETHEGALDLLTMICQSLQEQVDRAVLYPVSTPAGEVLDSPAFLASAAASRDAALASARESAASAGQAAQSASQSAASAGQAAQSAAKAEGVAATLDGAVKVSATDAVARSLSAKLAAGDGLAESVLDPGGDETLRLSVALAAGSGLEFSSGRLAVKAGQGLALSASGLAANVGTSAGQLVQLDAAGRLPALDAQNLARVADQLARDNAAQNAFVSWLAAGRASGPVPKGYLWTFSTDEWSKANAAFDAAGGCYHNESPPTQIAQGVGAAIGTMTGMGGLAAAFDGNTSQANNACAYVAASTGYVGKDWGSGTTRRVVGFKYWASNNYGFAYSGSGNVTLTLLGSNTNDVATATSLGSVSVANVNSAVAEFTNSSIGTAYRYHWVSCAQSGATQVNCAEVQFFEAGAASNMTLYSMPVSLGYVPARATMYLLHRGVDAVTLNTDVKVAASRVSGWTYATDLADLGAFDAEYKLLRCTVDISGATSGSLGYVRVDTFNAKRQRVRAALAWFQ